MRLDLVLGVDRLRRALLAHLGRIVLRVGAEGALEALRQRQVVREHPGVDACAEQARPELADDLVLLDVLELVHHRHVHLAHLLRLHAAVDEEADGGDGDDGRRRPAASSSPSSVSEKTSGSGGVAALGLFMDRPGPAEFSWPRIIVADQARSESAAVTWWRAISLRQPSAKSVLSSGLARRAAASARLRDRPRRRGVRRRATGGRVGASCGREPTPPRTMRASSTTPPASSRTAAATPSTGKSNDPRRRSFQ